MPKKRTDENSIAAVFGRKLIELRKTRQLTQYELAEKVGIPRNTISYLESRANNVTLESVKKMADFFGVPIETLIIEESEQTKKKTGPESRLDQQVQKIKKLSSFKQRMITDMLEAALNAK